MKELFNNSELAAVRDNVKKFNKKIESEMSYASFLNGDVLDFDWLDYFEDVCPRIDIIVRNAKVALIQVANIEQVEKAKRITVESVKDLSKHTNYINEIDEHGDVKPGKILDIRSEETFNIYENRFLYTLLHDMERFLLDKEELLKSFEIVDKKVLEYKAKSYSEKDIVDIELKITSNSIPSDQANEKLKEKINDFKQRIKGIKIYISSWYRSEMIKSLMAQHVQFLRPPLKKTNVLLKNPNFKVATKFWDFIRNYDSVNMNQKPDVESNGNDYMLSFLNHGFLIDYSVVDSIFSSKREQKKNLSNYAVVVLGYEMKKIIELLESQGVKVDVEDLLRMLANEIDLHKNEKDDKATETGKEEIKKKFKKAMDEYLERAQEYL